MFLAELSKENQKYYLEVAYALVNADGKVTEEELNNLNLYKAEIPDMSDINDYKTNSISEPLKKLSLLDNKTKKKVYFELISLAYTDAEYSVEEKELIKSVISGFELSDSERKEMDTIAENLMNLLNRLGVLINE